MPWRDCGFTGGRPAKAHWGYPDPSDVQGTPEQQREAFRHTMLAIKRRLELLICLPPVYWCWPILAWATRRPITARLQLMALAALTCWHWPAGLFTALSIALIWTAKTLKTTPRPQRKGGPVIKNYYFWS